MINMEHQNNKIKQGRQGEWKNDNKIDLEKYNYSNQETGQEMKPFDEGLGQEQDYTNFEILKQKEEYEHDLELYQEQEQEQESELGLRNEQEQENEAEFEQEQEQESNEELDQEQEQKSHGDFKQEQEQEDDVELDQEQEHEIDVDLDQEQEQESHEEFKQEQEEEREEQHDNKHEQEEFEPELEQESDVEFDQEREQDPDFTLDEEEDHDSDDDEGQSDDTFHVTRRKNEYRKEKIRKKCGIYSCLECSESFPSQSSLSKHRLFHKLTCVVCDEMFRLAVEFEGHMREHEGVETPYWCNKCDKKYSTLLKLRIHRRRCGRFECSECGKVFLSKNGFMEHMVVHADSSVSRCDICGKQLSSATSKTAHMLTHRDEKPFACVVCDKRFKYKRSFKYHMQEHSGTKFTAEYDCVVCDKKLKGINSLRAHMDIHEGKKEFECNICGKRFTQSSSRDGHERTHYNKTLRFSERLCDDQLKNNIFNSFDCTECLLSFTSQAFLNKHMELVHKVKLVKKPPKCEGFQCRLCSKYVRSPKKLNAHYLDEHCIMMSKESNDATGVVSLSSARSRGVTYPQPRDGSGRFLHFPKLNDKSACPPQQYECKYCNKVVTSATIGDHMRIHGKKKYVCRVCGLTSIHMTNLKRHLMTHTNEKNITCFEGYNASHQTNRNVAHRMMDRGNEFVCRVCGVTFSYIQNLKRHMTLHTSELPYGCEQCDKKFRTRESLKRHKSSHEGKKTALVKKYGCETCGKMFVDNYHLDRHKITHMKRHRCHRCKRSFVDVNIYEQHMRTHTLT